MVVALLIVIAIGVLLLSNEGKRILWWAICLGAICTAVLIIFAIGVVGYQLVIDNLDIIKDIWFFIVAACVLGYGLYGVRNLWRFLKRDITEKLEDGSIIYTPSPLARWKNRPLKFNALRRIFCLPIKWNDWALFFGVFSFIPSLFTIPYAIEQNNLWHPLLTFAYLAILEFALILSISIASPMVIYSMRLVTRLAFGIFK